MPTPREEFEAFNKGPISDEEWQWIKEFLSKHSERAVDFDSNHPVVHTEWVDAVRVRNAGGHGGDRVYDIKECEFLLKQPKSSWDEEYNASHSSDTSHQFALTPKERYEVKRIIREEIRAAYHEEFFGED